MFAGLELSIAAFAHSDYRGWGFFDDPQASVRHEPSLAHLTQEWPRPVEIKRHHYPGSQQIAHRLIIIHDQNFVHAHASI